MMTAKPMKFEDYVSEMALRGHLPNCTSSTLESFGVKQRWNKAKFIFKDIAKNGPFAGNACKWKDENFGDITEPKDAFYVWWDI